MFPSLLYFSDYLCAVYPWVIQECELTRAASGVGPGSRLRPPLSSIRGTPVVRRDHPRATPARRPPAGAAGDWPCHLRHNVSLRTTEYTIRHYYYSTQHNQHAITQSRSLTDRVTNPNYRLRPARDRRERHPRQQSYAQLERKMGAQLTPPGPANNRVY